MFLAAMAFVAAALVQIQIDVSVYNTYIVWQFVSGLVKYYLMLSWPCMARNRCSIVESRNSLEPGLQEIYIMTKSKLRVSHFDPLNGNTFTVYRIGMHKKEIILFAKSLLVPRAIY